MSYTFLRPRRESYKCACGCGETITIDASEGYARWYSRPQYRLGHANKGRPRSDRYQPKPEEIPSGFCECGCGQRTNIVKETARKRRHFAGYPYPYVRSHSRDSKGAKASRWKGGRWTHKSGYVYVYKPGHPRANRDSYVLEHHLVMEASLGRYLQPGEIVHHMNHVTDDNRLENLMLMTGGDHTSLHRKGKSQNVSPEGRERMRQGGRKGAASRWGHSP